MPSRGSTKPRHATKPTKIRDVPTPRVNVLNCHPSHQYGHIAPRRRPRSTHRQATGQTSSALGFPDERNRFQRFSFITKYYVDPGIVKQMGWFGTVTAKLRYTWERNANTNYATDNFSPYSPSAADAGGNDITNGGRSLFLAYNNPNYTAQIIMASLAWKW
jgi:hypothetical protein